MVGMEQDNGHAYTLSKNGILSAMVEGKRMKAHLCCCGMRVTDSREPCYQDNGEEGDDNDTGEEEEDEVDDSEDECINDEDAM